MNLGVIELLMLIDFASIARALNLVPHMYPVCVSLFIVKPLFTFFLLFFTIHTQ